MYNPSNEKMVRLLLKYGASALDIAYKDYISDEIKDIFVYLDI